MPALQYQGVATLVQGINDVNTVIESAKPLTLPPGSQLFSHLPDLQNPSGEARCGVWHVKAQTGRTASRMINIQVQAVF